MKLIVAGVVSVAVSGCAGAPFVPPPLPEPAVPTSAITPVRAPSLTADYTHRTPLEPEEPAAPATPGFARPRIGS